MRNIGVLKTVAYFVIGVCFAVAAAASAMGSFEPGQTGTPPSAPSESPPEGTSQPATTTGQGSDEASETTSGPAQESTPVIWAYMPDGQLKSHPVRVYVPHNILSDQNPRLQLMRITEPGEEEGKKRYEPSLVAPNQEWTEVTKGQEVHRSGTLLLFDLNQIDFKYRAMRRVLPVVYWTEGGVERVAVAKSEVNVANIVADVGWTMLVVVLAILVVVGLSVRNGANPLLLLTGVDGHLSLAQTQIACWTLVVGGVVLGYGFIRLQIPSIPQSLLVLMGTSLTTGGLGFFQDGRNQQAAVAAGNSVIRHTWSLGDLVRRFPPGQPPELSLAKAQMLFWTVILLTLFLAKSILDGSIWDVPWALVALLGFSQAGYLVPKVAQTDGGAPQAPSPPPAKGQLPSDPEA